MTSLEPRRALAHPVWWAALGLLVLNDHVLKHLPEPDLVTGKLSDLAGLVVAPWLLAVLLRLRHRRSVDAAHVATGLVFAAINVSPEAAAAVEALSRLLGVPWAIHVDPTDLLALPALLASRLGLGAIAAGDARLDARWARLAVAPGLIACVATSAEPPPNDFPPPPPRTPSPFSGAASFSQLVFGNRTDAELILRVRPLADDVEIDCAAVGAIPSFALARELFAPATAFAVPAGRALPVFDDPSVASGARSACNAFLVDASGLAPRLVFWSAIAPTTISQDAAVADSRRMLAVEAESAGRLRWVGHDALFPPPSDAPPEAASDPSLCPAARAPTIDVSAGFPTGEALVLSQASASPDGCWRLGLTAGGRERVGYLCLGHAELPFALGDTLRVRPLDADGRGLVVEGERARLALNVGTELALPIADHRVVAMALAAGCPRSRDACGGTWLPLSIELEGPEGRFRVRGGGAARLGDGALYLGRVAARPVRRTSCPGDVGATHVESVYLEVYP